MTEEPGKSHTGVKRPGGVSSNWRAEALSEEGSAVQSLICVCLFGPVDGSPPGSSVHGILQARTLEWVATPSSRTLNLGTMKILCLMLMTLRHVYIRLANKH